MRDSGSSPECGGVGVPAVPVRPGDDLHGVHLGQAHRKHAFQLMANELGMSHVVVSLIYMAVQLAVSLGFIYLCPDTVVAHWVYFVVAAVVLGLAYVEFMRKYYHLHEEYLKSLEK